jgi:hypothetical protein
MGSSRNSAPDSNDAGVARLPPSSRVRLLPTPGIVPTPPKDPLVFRLACLVPHSSPGRHPPARSSPHAAAATSAQRAPAISMASPEFLSQIGEIQRFLEEGSL